MMEPFHAQPLQNLFMLLVMVFILIPPHFCLLLLLLTLLFLTISVIGWCEFFFFMTSYNLLANLRAQRVEVRDCPTYLGVLTDGPGGRDDNS